MTLVPKQTACRMAGNPATDGCIPVQATEHGGIIAQIVLMCARCKWLERGTVTDDVRRDNRMMIGHASVSSSLSQSRDCAGDEGMLRGRFGRNNYQWRRNPQQKTKKTTTYDAGIERKLSAQIYFSSKPLNC